MHVGISEAKKRFTELVRAVENGEVVVITRHGKPVAEILRPTPKRRRIQWGGMRGRIDLKAGWDNPVDLDRFLAGDL